jgi:hypothetical protein
VNFDGGVDMMGENFDSGVEEFLKIFECGVVVVVLCRFFGVEDVRILVGILLVEAGLIRGFVGLPVDLHAISVRLRKVE